MKKAKQKKLNNKIHVIPSECSKQFIENFNKNKPTEEFIESCKKARELFDGGNDKSTDQNVADVPSGDFVIRDAVVDTILKTYTRLKGHPTANHLIENIDALPGADKPQGEDWDKYSEKLWRLAYERGMNARPKGEWIENDALGWKCSKCGIITNLESNFCPCCGARMKGGAE